MKAKTDSVDSVCRKKVHCADRIREQALLTAGEGPANAAEKPSATHWTLLAWSTGPSGWTLLGPNYHPSDALPNLASGADLTWVS